jgi:hypothetical protein
MENGLSNGPVDSNMVVKDVQAELLLEKKSLRKPGQVVYPLVYSSEMMDLYDAYLLCRFQITNIVQ